MKDVLVFDDNKISVKYFIVLLFVAFIFSVSCRMIWVSQFSDIESFKWNHELMINTNDGYYYAEGARDIIAGIHQENDLSPINSPLSKLTAILASILPIELETLTLYMPTFFGSLLILPIMLIARVFNQDRVGFVAALLGGITWSYYNRTMTGYFDTDLLIVVLPTFAIWGVLLALKNEKNRFLIVAPLFALLAMYWHNGTNNIVNAIFLITIFYTFIFERKNIFYYKFLSVFVLVLTTLPIMVKLSLILLLVAIYHFFKEKLTNNMIMLFTIVSTIVYLVFGGASWIVSLFNSAYITRALNAADLDFALNYFGVVGTVREAGQIPFETFANRISGHTVTFVLSVIGYLLLIIRHKLFLLTLPMVGLGFFALQGGLRFTVFAIPFMALGVSYLIFIFANIIKAYVADNMQRYAQYAFISLAAIAVLYPNIIHIIEYRVPTVFTKAEVGVLDKLGQIASREDYVLSWWDYGYPIRYYADVKTLVDGAKHSGGSNFPVSFALMNDQVSAANMLRLNVEFTEKNFKEPCGTSIECVLKVSNIKNPNQFIKALRSKDVVLPPKTRDAYIYLPNRMMNILPTINMFSNLDLLSGQQYKQPFFYLSKNFQEKNNVINFGRGMSLDKSNAVLNVGDNKVQLKSFIVVSHDKDGKLQRNVSTINKESTISVIFMPEYNQFLLLDDKVFNSLYIQLFVLENYDKDLFEPVIFSPLAKVYKLKI